MISPGPANTNSPGGKAKDGGEKKRGRPAVMANRPEGERNRRRLPRGRCRRTAGVKKSGKPTLEQSVPIAGRLEKRIPLGFRAIEDNRSSIQMKLQTCGLSEEPVDFEANRALASPRLRQSLTALGFGYGLNEN